MFTSQSADAYIVLTSRIYVINVSAVGEGLNEFVCVCVGGGDGDAL